MSAQLVAAQADLDFLHSDCVLLTAPVTALQAYCAMGLGGLIYESVQNECRGIDSDRVYPARLHGDQCECDDLFGLSVYRLSTSLFFAFNWLIGIKESQ